MSEQADPYAGIAEWYDLEHDAESDDIECYLSLLAAPASGRASVLEIGSGTGRVAAALAVAGHEVTGIEPSVAMRDRAELRARQLPERVRHRLRTRPGSATAPGLDPSATFDVALFGQGALAHLTSASERYAALQAVRRHIKPGGQLLVDVDLLGPRRLLESPRLLWWQGTWRLADSAHEVSHFVAGAPGPAPATVEVLHLYDAHEPGGTVARTSSRMTLALLTYGEVLSELLRAGFSMEAAYGAYDLAPYEQDSARLIADARV